MINPDSIITQSQDIALFIPENPLTGNAISIGHTKANTFCHWKTEDDTQMYYQLQKIILVWRKYFQRDHYVVYGSNSKDGFSFEAIPFKKGANPLTSQAKVIYRIMTKGHKISSDTKSTMKKDYIEKLNKTPLRIEKNLSQFVKIADPFCQKQVIEKQTILEGKKVRVLLDHAPLIGGKIPLHFLIVPIEHKENFQELSLEEYTEAMHFARLICGHYNYLQPHIFHKNGRVAGQSIDHWHLHILFTASKSQSLTAKAKMLKNMLFGKAPLSDKELSTRLQQAIVF